MTSRRTFLLASSSCLAGLIISKPSLAQQADLLEEVASARKEIQTLVATFEQVRRIELLATDVRSRGKMTLVRPNRLRWELFAPDSMTYWVGPEGLAFSTGSSHGAVDPSSAGPIGNVMNDLLTFFGGDLRSLHSRYELNATRSEERVQIEARPRDPSLQKVMRKLKVVLAPDRVSPVHVTIEESETDSIFVRFLKVERNVTVDPSLMRPASP